MAVAGEAVTARDVEDAAGLIAGKVRETPVLEAGELSRRVGARVVLKAENLQLTGSFKARGATNMIGRLPAQALRAGVVAASAGNHAQAVACAARDAGARAVLVMPEEAPVAKVLEICAARGFAAGYPLGREYPEYENGLLVAITERRTRTQIDALAEAIGAAIAEQSPNALGVG